MTLIALVIHDVQRILSSKSPLGPSYSAVERRDGVSEDLPGMRDINFVPADVMTRNAFMFGPWIVDIASACGPLNSVADRPLVQRTPGQLHGRVGRSGHRRRPPPLRP